MAERQPGKKLILRIFLLAFLAALLAGSVSFIFNPQLRLQVFSLFEKEPPALLASLEDMQELFTLNTSEYIYKVVFPHDLLPAGRDKKTFVLIEEKIKSGTALSETEKQNQAIYQFLDSIGMNFKRRPYDFMVVRLAVKGGYTEGQFLEHKDWMNTKLVKTADKVMRVVEFRLPPATITDILVDDSPQSQYDYPDIRVSPAQWKRITSLVKEQIRETVIKDGLLEETEKQAKLFFESFLLQAGFDEINFIQ